MVCSLKSFQCAFPGVAIIKYCSSARVEQEGVPNPKLVIHAEVNLSRSGVGAICSSADRRQVHKIPVVPHKAVAEVSKIGNL